MGNIWWQKNKGPAVREEEFTGQDAHPVLCYLTGTGFQKWWNAIQNFKTSNFKISSPHQDRPLKREKSFGERQSSVTSPGDAGLFISSCILRIIFGFCLFVGELLLNMPIIQNFCLDFYRISVLIISPAQEMSHWRRHLGQPPTRGWDKSWIYPFRREKHRKTSS